MAIKHQAMRSARLARVLISESDRNNKGNLIGDDQELCVIRFACCVP